MEGIVYDKKGNWLTRMVTRITDNGSESVLVTTPYSQQYISKEKIGKIEGVRVEVVRPQEPKK